MISLIQYDLGDYATAEQSVFSLVSEYPTYEDWKHKGFILLVNTYLGLNDLFQARATAESIMENVEEDWVQEACSDLMMKIEELEAAELAPEETEKEVEEENNNDDEQDK